MFYIIVPVIFALLCFVFPLNRIRHLIIPLQISLLVTFLVLLYQLLSQAGFSLNVFLSQLLLMLGTFITWLLVVHWDEADGKEILGLMLIGYSINSGLALSTSPVIIILFWALMPVPLGLYLLKAEEVGGHGFKGTPRSFALYQAVGMIFAFLAALAFLHSDKTAPYFLALAIMVRQAEFPFHSWLLSLKQQKVLPLICQFLLFHSGIVLYLKLFSPTAGELTYNLAPFMTILTMFSGLYLGLLAWRSKNFIQKAVLIVFSQSSFLLAGTEGINNSALGGSIVYWMAHVFAGGLFLVIIGNVIKQKQVFLADKYYGLGHKLPLQSVVFLMSGLILVGCPLTLGFVGEDVLFHTFIDTYPFLGFIMIVLTALNGFNVYNSYCLLFLGPEYKSWMKGIIKKQEVLSYAIVLTILVVLGIFPRMYTDSVNQALTVDKEGYKNEITK